MDPIERAIVSALLEIGSRESAEGSAPLRERLFAEEQYGNANQAVVLARCYAISGETAKLKDCIVGAPPRPPLASMIMVMVGFLLAVWLAMSRRTLKAMRDCGL